MINMKDENHVLVIGGGAAGMMAACTAAAAGAQVDLYEKNEKCGKKIYITGKGRCNLTNNCSQDEFREQVCSNPRFLYSALQSWDSSDTIRFFEENGTKTKTERGGRVFPVTDHASDVTAALQRCMKKNGVRVHLQCGVKELLLDCPEQTSAAALQSTEGVSGGNLSTTLVGSSLQSTEGVSGGNLSATSVESARRSIEDISYHDNKPVRGEGIAPKNPDKAPYKVKGILLEDGRKVFAERVIVATGGLSYPSTGSDGDGYRFAGQAGLKVVPCVPSLVPVETEEDDARQMQGLSLRNVNLKIQLGKKILFEEFGEMMFTHFGVSGPLILSASTVLGRICDNLSNLGESSASGSSVPLKLNNSTGKSPANSSATNKSPVNNLATGKSPVNSSATSKSPVIRIDLKPALDTDQFDRRLLREFAASPNKIASNILTSVYPAKMIPVILKRCGISPDTQANQITKEQRGRLVSCTKEFSLTVRCLRGFNEAVITAGGVSVKEIRPDTMESKKVEGLYFAGEVLDLDARTGGYNLQIAWTTGHAAGAAAGSLSAQ